ncbi:hypothetical protein AMECASPLE_024510 [Ameca splendens]|uniref:Uncharacterized protein n=1 Tax=Ameca splendens TaxID=208324 RepID=A0ABV1A165_9TELE
MEQLQQKRTSEPLKLSEQEELRQNLVLPIPSETHEAHEQSDIPDCVWQEVNPPQWLVTHHASHHFLQTLSPQKHSHKTISLGTLKVTTLQETRLSKTRLAEVRSG